MHTKAVFPKLGKKAKEFQIQFTHFTNDNSIPWPDVKEMLTNPEDGHAPVRNGTLCTLYDTNKNRMYHGWAVVNPHDTFRKNTGRRLSLNNALKAGGVSQQERRRIAKEWEEFTKHKPKATQSVSKQCCRGLNSMIAEQVKEYMEKNKHYISWAEFPWTPLRPSYEVTCQTTRTGGE